jgi:hypothetical protein
MGFKWEDTIYFPLDEDREVALVQVSRAIGSSVAEAV